LSEFEVMDGEEEDIFIGKHDDVLREDREDTNKWFHSWEKATLKDGVLVIVMVFIVWTVKKMTMKGHLDELRKGIRNRSPKGT
jgi:hypothetical protein